jgi:hypothetical protein
MFHRWFRAHPQSVGETYLDHQQIAFGFSAALLKAGLACFIHGLVPALFATTASRTIGELHEKVAARQNHPMPVVKQSALKASAAH